MKHQVKEDFAKLPSETAHYKAHSRKQGGWKIQSNCLRKVARGHSRMHEVVVAEDK
jgi:hypothetical protein